MTLETFLDNVLKQEFPDLTLKFVENASRGQSRTFFISNESDEKIFIAKFFDHLKNFDINQETVGVSENIEHLFELLEEDESNIYSVEELIEYVLFSKRCFERYVSVARMEGLTCFPKLYFYLNDFKIENSYFSCLIEEVVQGATLEETLRSRQSTSESTILDFLAQMADIVHELQANGIVHRDISPDNIMLSDGNYILIDPGIVKMDGIGDATKTGFLLGKWFYSSPEQMLGNAKASDFSSDLYAIGIIALELATGINYLKKYHTSGFANFHEKLLNQFEREIEDDYYDIHPETPLSSSLLLIIKKLVQIEKRLRFDSIDSLLITLKSIREAQV